MVLMLRGRDLRCRRASSARRIRRSSRMECDLASLGFHLERDFRPGGPGRRFDRPVQRRVRVGSALRQPDARADARRTLAFGGISRRLVQFRGRGLRRPGSGPRAVGPGFRETGDRLDAGRGLWESLRHHDGLDLGARRRERPGALEHIEGEGILFPRGLQQLRVCGNVERDRRSIERDRRCAVVGNPVAREDVVQRHHLVTQGRIRPGVRRNVQ